MHFCEDFSESIFEAKAPFRHLAFGIRLFALFEADVHKSITINRPYRDLTARIYRPFVYMYVFIVVIVGH